MVADLTKDLLDCPEVTKVVITQNVPEDERYPADARIEVVRNRIARGYGANQNTALLDAATPFLCVLNPDIRLTGNPFPLLLEPLRDGAIAASAPVIARPDGETEDSARKFPTALGLVGKALGLGDGTYRDTAGTLNPDWLAGMFLLLRSSAFRGVGGFDENYFLYYEDVDLCWRLRSRGHELRQVMNVSAVHDARRASRRDWQHARWHLASMMRFLARSARG
jgi:GT2 family glycosyltransferase